MLKNRWSTVLVVTCLFLGIAVLRAATPADRKAEQTLHIDIPAKLPNANVVFNIDHLALNGDMPIALGHLGLLADDYRELSTKGEIIAVIHTNAGHLVVNDNTYNRARHVTGGNPYKGLVAELMKKGVRFELCAATAKANNWGNADLLPGVKVNVDAMVRLAQLGQEGYVQITE